MLTLIAPAARCDLDEPAIERVRAALGAAGAVLGTPVWLAPARACDLPFTALDPAVAQTAARAALGSAGLDLAVQPADGRRKRLLVADMESTVIRNEMLDELADFVGLRAQVAAVTARAMNGELDFRAAVRERVALLADLPVAVLEQAHERVELDPGAAVLLATLRRHGIRTALVSGGFGFFARRVAERLGFEHVQANELEIAEGRLTGRAVEPILDRDAKLATLQRLCGEMGIAPGEAAAVGDGANDLPMLAAAGLGVAYHAKPVVAAAARVRIDHGDLSSLLYLQGYREEEIRG